MSIANFKIAFEKAMSWEIAGGGPIDLSDPRVQAGDISTPELRRKTGYTTGTSGASKYDTGGETKFGVAQNAHKGKVVVRTMNLAQAQEIYHKGYWLASRCDELPDLVARYVFDIGCGSGPNRANKMLQQALGVTVDGALGPKTMAAAQAANDLELLKKLVELRCNFYRSIVANNPSQAIFLKGWLRRANDLR